MIKIISFIFIIIVAGACGGQQKELVREEETSKPPTGNKVSLTRKQMETIGIAVGHIENKNLQNAVRANGMLTVPNQNKAFVTSVMSGIIRTLNIQPGNIVFKGQVVATITNPDMAQHQQELQTINAQIELAEMEYKRQEELVAGAAAPLKNLQRVHTELTTLKTTRNSLWQQLKAMGVSVDQVQKGSIVTTLPVTAPIKGTVSNVSAQIGSNVDAATPIAEIVNNEQLHLDLFVYEKDLSLIKDRETIHFTLTNNPGKEYDAEIFSIGAAFVKETKTIPIHAVVKGNKTGLIEGMNITALISVGENVVPAVPSEAIVSDQGQDYIFIRLNTSHNKDSAQIDLQRVPVVKGVSDIGYTAITFLHPVPPESLVVVKGAFFVLAKMTNTGETQNF
jgi:cobalt-zinc-cadmium efflux system membrane fusion protein